MRALKNILPRAIGIFIIFSIICGIVYTGVVTGISQIAFPYRANGSIIEIDGKKYGSELLGQEYKDESHMWGRIMNVDFLTYKDEEGNPLMYATPSNLSPASKEYQELISERIEKIKNLNPDKGNSAIPVDLITCSGSGLDPHISKAAADYQIERLSKANNMTEEEIKATIDECTEERFLGIFGEERVNVLKFNLKIEGIIK